MSRLIVGPFNRVEGDLEVTLDVEDGVVRSAQVNSPLFRGFEQILLGKHPLDALMFVPRICGICSVSQSAAAAAALSQAMCVSAPVNGELAHNLIAGCENLADHFSHFYLFFMPDFAREAYAKRVWHAEAVSRFKAVSGSAAAEVLPARRDFLELQGFMAGKWPHTLALQPGGSTRPVDASERIRIIALLRAFRAYLERTLFGDALEAIAALDNCAALDAWRDARPVAHSDFRRYLELARDCGLDRIGAGPGVYLSHGSYAFEGGRLLRRGVWDGDLHELLPEAITEDVSHAWLAGEDAARNPAQGATLPQADKAGAYTWCKAPRWNGRVAETGALARLAVQGHPLARELARSGGSVHARVVCRLLEIALVLPQMERWAKALQPGAPFCETSSLPDEADSVGMVEAARGALGHWLSIRRGRIANYQIVAPTTWNFSPRDATGVPGALEQALVGVTAGDGAAPAIQHVVRSFDPCMVCTVH